MKVLSIFTLLSCGVMPLSGQVISGSTLISCGAPALNKETTLGGDSWLDEGSALGDVLLVK